MAFDITTTAQALQTHWTGSNLLFSVDIARPRGGTPQGPYVAIFPAGMRVVEVTLANTIEQHVLRVEMFISPTARDQQERVLEGARLASQLIDYVLGDYTLGGAVRNVDVAGQYGQGIEVEFPEPEFVVPGAPAATITIPVIVDGSATLAE